MEEVKDRLHAERLLKREGVRVAGKPQGDLMLHAARLGLIKVVEFFAKSVSVEYRNRMQDSLLHYAARGGQRELVSDLIDTGINPLILNLFNETPLMNAAEEGHVEVVKKLLERGGTRLQDKFGDTALHFAAREGHQEVCHEILRKDYEMINMLNDQKQTPLAYAYSSGHLDTAKLLERYGGKTAVV